MRYGSAAAGTTITSCAFAQAVAAEYLRQATPGHDAVIQAYSPAKRRSYTMRCTGGPVITCTGGNDALVFLY